MITGREHIVILIMHIAHKTNKQKLLQTNSTVEVPKNCANMCRPLQTIAQTKATTHVKAHPRP